MIPRNLWTAALGVTLVTSPLSTGARAATPDAGTSAPLAAGALTEASPPGAPAYVRLARSALDTALASGDLELRSEGLTALGASRIPEARALLEKALTSEEGKLRFAAARGLALLGDKASAPAIVDAYRDEKGWAVRKELAIAAGATGATELIPELRAATNEAQKDLAIAAAWSLVSLKDAQGKLALERLGNPPKKNADTAGVTRWSRRVLAGEKKGDLHLAIRTLVELGEPADLRLVRPHLASTDERLRLWASAGVLRFSQT